MNQGRPGDYLGGTVTVAGGALPWDPVPITVTCDGKIRYTSTADPKGKFLIAPVETDTSLSRQRRYEDETRGAVRGLRGTSRTAGF